MRTAAVEGKTLVAAMSLLSSAPSPALTEVLARKAAIETAIAGCDAQGFARHLQAWLEATAFLRTLPGLRQLGIETQAIPAFEAADLRDVSIRKEADDAVMAFCISAGLAGDMASFKSVDRLLTERFGIIYPGSSALYHCNQSIDPIVTLDDAVGQVLKQLLEGAALLRGDVWNAGLRLLQLLRSSSFGPALTPLIASWLRRRFGDVAAACAIEPERSGSVRSLEAALADRHDDQAFIAAILVAGAALLERPADADYLMQLAKLAQRP